jgi:Peptidase family M23
MQLVALARTLMTRLVRPAIALASLLGAIAAQAGELGLPFTGQWFVAQAGDTINVNHHMAARPQWYGVDFVKTGGVSDRELSPPRPTQLQDFYAWDQAVLAPHGGEVVTVVNDLPDNPLGVKDADHPAGNYVAIKIAENRFVFIGHLQHGSVVVQSGERVASGQFLGRCGNSGNSDVPHIHLHVQDQAELNTGEGQLPVFASMDVQWSGQRLENVTWPLLRGQCVAPH